MKPVFVTQAFMPPFDEYVELIRGCWDNRHLTNNGPLLRQFESELRTFLGSPNVLCLGNGTLALQLAIRALDLRGKILTTPFSYVATTGSILWEQCEPVFVDISPDDFNLDPAKLEAAMTPDTVAIMAVHVYGNPCDVKAIESIAKRRNLKVIYDGAHAMGVRYKGKPIGEYGDVTTFSLHATKLIHSIEGGVVMCESSEVFEKLSLLRAFGQVADDQIMLGINAKMSEFHAAMGSLVLRRHEQIIQNRKQTCEFYASKANALGLFLPKARSGTTSNYAYFPVAFANRAMRDKVFESMKSEQIFTRKYFEPSLNKLPYLKSHYSCPVSESAAERVLCLPLYSDIEFADAERVAKSLENAMRSL